MGNLIERENKSLFQTYKRLNIEIESANGVRLTDIEGNVYLDFLGGIAVNLLGHSHPKIINAITEQINKYMHVSNFFYQEPQVKLAERLKEITQMDRVFFCNSGSETSEGASKLAKLWGSKNGKKDIISFTGGFHGRTYGALSMMNKPLYMEGMGPFLEDRKILEYNNNQALEKGIDENTAAVFLEFMQGEGGLTIVSHEFIQKLKELKEKFGFLLIADEVQTGVGRTGKFSFYEYYDIEADIITIAKGIGGGLPLAAFLAKEEIANLWSYGQHGTTFGGNSVSCAAGLAVIEELIDNNLIGNINDVSEYLNLKLNEVKNEFPLIVKEVRGKGLMTGLLLSIEAREVVDKLLEKKVITNATSINVLRLLPPYIINKNDVDEFINNLKEVLKGINL
ncbi:MAG: aspartate aminotransferase family protein [Candidatus Kapaibacteriota bacterium]